MTTDTHMSMLMETWYHALKAEHGLRLESPDRIFLQKQLYAARQSAMDPDLDTLAIVTDARDDKVLWIVRKDAANGSVQEPPGD